jgi:Uma2 family endonuclease
MQTSPVTTAAQLLELREPEFRHELVRGELRRMSHAGFWHGAVALRIGARILAYVEQKRLGMVVAAETGFWLEHDPDTVRCPDVAFVAAGRYLPTIRRGYFDGAPDLAVEVTSPSDSYRAVHEKALFWIARGTRLVWVVEPVRSLVTVYRPDGSQQVLRDDDELTGNDVLPGFSVRVRELFPDTPA